MEDTMKTEDEQIEQILAETNQQVTDVNNDNPASNEEVVKQEPIEQPADDFDGTKWQLNYKGEFIAPKSREELIALAQKGIGYSKSQEAINQEKQRLQETMAQVKPYLELDQRFREDPNLQAHIQKALAEYQQTAANNTDPLANNPIVNELYAQVNEIKQFKAQQEQSAADGELQREIQELKSSFPNEQWDAHDGEGTFLQHLLRHAYENNISNLKTAYRDLAFDKTIANVKAEALKEATSKKTGNLNASKVGGGVNNAPLKGDITYKAGDEYQDLVDKALQMLG
jgi:hypothetical protein